MNSESKSRQGGGLVQAWQSPDGAFRHCLVRLDLDCEPDPYPGIVILANAGYQQAFAYEVLDCRKELPGLVAKFEGTPVAYWSLESNASERKRILAGLTQHPVFYG